MDAGTAAATSNGRLRQQLLSSDSYADQGAQYDPYGIEARKAPGLRKASLTSQSVMSMNRFFRRKGPADGAFNDDSGADVLYFTDGANVSFDDIAHLRDHGPYVTGMGRQDTAPIIPTLGTGSSGGKSVNNIQYRKQMNQQKKMALASGARAMSMGGQNPMNPPADPRAMSMGGFNPVNDPRSMSLMSGNPMDPRSMSLMTGNPMDPRTMSMGGMPNGGMPNGNMPSGNGANGPYGVPTMNPNGRAMSMGGPRTMSMGQRPPMAQYGGQFQGQPIGQGPYGQYNSQPGYGYQPGPAVPGQAVPHAVPGQGQYARPLRQPPNGAGPRTMSLNSNGNLSPPSRMPPNQQLRPPGPMAPPVGVTQNQLYSRNLVGANGEMYQRVSPADSQGDMSQSSDSLMKVEEEEENENNVNSHLSNEDDDDDVVYKFNEEDETVSRKSTLQKSNSMRLRKLDLFSHDRQPSKLAQDEIDAPVDIDNASFESRSFESTEGELHVNTSDAQNSRADVDREQDTMPSPTVGVTPKRGEGYNDPLPSPTKARDLPGLPADHASHTLPSKPSIRLLVTNTAYQNFRPPANDSNLTLGSSNYSDINTPKDEFVSGSFADSGDPDDHDDHDDHDEEEQRNGGKAHRWSQQETAPTTASTSHGSRRSEDHNQHARDVDHASVFDDKSSHGFDDRTSKDSKREFEKSRLKKDAAPESPREVRSESRRSSRTFSITSNIFKRLSKSGKRSSSVSEEPAAGAPRRMPSNAAPSSASGKAPEGSGVKFTKEELGIMQENGALLNELELVSTELASSIRREVALEYRLQGRESGQAESDLLHELTQKLKHISDLQEKLNKERRLRFISEEHALFLENGVSPSPLKLNYEKTELYKQLLIKNDMVNQLQDKLAEYQDKDEYLLLYEKYHDLVKEHTELKYNVVPELERRAKGVRVPADRGLVLASGEEDDYSQALEIARLQSQREDLREVIGKMQQQHKIELNHAHDKIRKLEAKLRDIALINEKLTSRMESNSADGSNNSLVQNLPLPGGKLQGLSIVSPKKTIFD